MAVCIRGAITADKNEREEILSKTKEMLLAIIEKNNLNLEEITSVLFTATSDLDKVYPLNIEGSLRKCIRVMVTAENGKTQKEAKHVYLGGAKILRPDIK